MTTNARPTSNGDSSHWYSHDGAPCYEVPRADGKGMRKTTIADARKMDLLPSVTNVLNILRKPALEAWRAEQAILACLTSPRKDGEELDAFVKRILRDEKVQDQESQKARDKGSEIHQALEDLFQGKPISPEIEPWIRPAFDAVCKYGELVATERVLVGDGYAGKTDLIQLEKDCWRLWDFKSAKTLPTKGAYPEARLQLSAYAAAWQAYVASQPAQDIPIRTGNIYISTVDCGKFVICEHGTDWHDTYEQGFAPLVRHWQWANNHAC